MSEGTCARVCRWLLVSALASFCLWKGAGTASAYLESAGAGSYTDCWREAARNAPEGQEPPKKSVDGTHMCIGMCLGIVVGMFVSNFSKTWNQGICMSLGMCLGMAIGSAVDAAQARKAPEKPGEQSAEAEPSAEPEDKPEN